MPSPKFQHNDKNSFISSPSAHAILLCSLLANHAEKKDKNEAYKDIETAYNNLKSSPLLFKMEFLIHILDILEKVVNWE